VGPETSHLWQLEAQALQTPPGTMVDPLEKKVPVKPSMQLVAKPLFVVRQLTALASEQVLQLPPLREVPW
jgi:hypothetical protein